MKKYKIKSVPTKHGAFIRRRIDKSRRRAETVGLTYLFSLILITALTSCSLLLGDNIAAGIFSGMDVLMAPNFRSAQSSLMFVSAVLYAFTLLFLAINILRSLTYLKNLFKKKVSRIYGLNANIDAMESLGKIFSGSISCIAINHILIYMMSNSTAIVSPIAYIVAGLALLVHFICGFAGGKVSVFYIDEETGVSESKRPYGRIIPLIRNILQIVTVAVIAFIYIEYSNLYNVVAIVINNNFQAIEIAGDGLLPLAFDLVSLIWLMGMIGHALNTSEYSVEGPYTIGIRNFRIFSILMFLTSGISLLCEYILGEAIFTSNNGAVTYKLVAVLDENTLVVVLLALVMTILDIVLKLRWTKDAIAESEADRNQVIPNINVTTPKQPINIQLPQQPLPEINVHTPVQKPVELPPINVNMPAAQVQKPTPVSVNMAKTQKRGVTPITVNLPNAQTEEATPITVNMPSAQTQKPATVNVNMPGMGAVSSAPISLRMPKAQKKAAEKPLTINMPSAPAQSATPINLNMVGAQPRATAPITVNMPMQAARPATAMNLTLPMQAPQNAAPINVTVPAQVRSMAAPVNVMLPAEDVQNSAPANVVLPVQASQEAQAVNIVMPAAETKKAAEVNVMMPTSETKDVEPVNVVVPTQAAEEAAAVNVIMPTPEAKKEADVNVMMPTSETKDVEPVNVVVPTQAAEEAAAVNVIMPTPEAKKEADVNVMLPTSEAKDVA
ncbi:MAG: hypothetical protein IKD15_00810, partial [Clostridia bacterium]|nr:hypothetical protein [Clostridia bacterium]